MNKIHRIHLDTWLINSAIFGFYNILKHANKEHLIKLEKNKNYIEVDESFLDNFEEDYFNYFIDTHLDKLVHTKVIDKISTLLSLDDDFIAENLEEINNDIAYIQSKLSLNSVCTALSLAGAADRNIKIKKIKVTKKSDNIKEVKEQLKLADKLLHEKDIARYIKIENVIHSVLNNFQANAGVLNKNSAKFNKSQVFNEYFIEPAEDYLNISYKEKDETFICSTCDSAINTKKEAFNLAWLKGIGVDVNRKTNYYHNFINTTFICPICNLILSCIPAGFYFDLNSRKGIFINDNRSINSLISANKIADSKETVSEFENRSYQSYIDIVDKQGIENFNNINFNIQVVKFDANTSSPYSFNLIDNVFIENIYRNKNRLASLVNKVAKLDNEYIDLYQESIDSLLKYRNTFILFDTLLQGKYYNGITLSIILSLSIRGENSKKDSYLTRKFQIHGTKLAKILKIIDEQKLNKLKLAVSRAIKTNDILRFIDIISFQTSQCGIEMLKEITEITNDRVSFRLYGYALLAGLYIGEKPE